VDNQTRIKNETLRNSRVTVVANETALLMFNDTKPNSAFIRNYGSADVYVSIRSNPSTTDYDQVIAGGSLISLVKLQPFDRLFFFSTGECSLTVESFEVDNLRPADIPETQQIVFINTAPVNLGNIGEILSALPAGNNNIGNVDVVTLPSLPAGTNNIGDVDVVGWSDLITLLIDIKEELIAQTGLLDAIKNNTTP
jgi:hypothetical protein